MKYHIFFGILIAAMPAVAAAAQDPARDQTTPQTAPSAQGRDQDIYGWQMMTPDERATYHERMRSAKTVAEQDKIRQEHHDLMAARAKERGITLPAEPPAGRGPGYGMSPGSGMGPGSGMNSGQR